METIIVELKDKKQSSLIKELLSELRIRFKSMSNAEDIKKAEYLSYMGRFR